MERGDLFLLSYGFLGLIYSQNSDLLAKRRVASLDFFCTCPLDSLAGHLLFSLHEPELGISSAGLLSLC